MNKYKNLFSELKLGRRTARNRVFLSPMGDGMANSDGAISEQLIAYYSNIAKYGTAVITPGVLCVDYPKGKPLVNTSRMDDARFIKQYSMLADNVHRYGAFLIPQIHHAGAQTSSANTEGNAPVTSSDQDPGHIFIKMNRMAEKHHELTTAEVKELVQKFIQTAVNCKAAGCDGVSLHAAHGYLINQFLSPDINKRKDEYGGSFENRCRFADEIIRGIKDACGPDFIVGARIPGKEFVSDGLTDEDAIKVALLFEEAGCDYLDVSYGAVELPSRLMETSKYEQGNRLPTAEKIKSVVKRAKVGAVGVLREPGYCDQIIAEGRLDFVSMGRTLLSDPEWPQKSFEGREEEIRPCLNCLDGCMGRVAMGLSIGCVLNPVVGRERDFAKLSRTDSSKKIVVVGGGLAGMQAAATAAHVGHSVTLMEATDKLGGQLNLASVPPHKQRIAQAEKWFEGELDRQNVNVLLNTKADFNSIKILTPDLVIMATGAEPVSDLPIEGLDSAVQAWDFIAGDVTMPRNSNVTVIGGGIVGCEVAEMLLENDNKVTILEMLPAIATGLEGMHMSDLLIEFAQHQVDVQTGATAKRINLDSIEYEKEGKAQTLATDLVILAAGQKSVGKDIIDELRDNDYVVKVVGDAVHPRKFIDATREGFFAGVDA